MDAFVFGPIDARGFERFRWLFAWTLMIYTLAWARHASEWLTDAGYHVSAKASYGLQLPVPLLPGWALVPFLIVYLGAIAAVIAGYRPRLFSVVVLVGLLYVTTADRLASFTMNKIFLMGWAVLACAPPVQAQGTKRVLRSAWPVRVLQATLLIQYVGAGVCKIQGDWLAHSDTLWAQAQLPFMTDLAAWMVRNVPKGPWAAMQWAALAFELAAPLLFLVPRLRTLGFVWGLGMHLMIGLMMYQVGYFSLQIVCFYVLFMQPQTLQRVTQWIEGMVGSSRADEDAG